MIQKKITKLKKNIFFTIYITLNVFAFIQTSFSITILIKKKEINTSIIYYMPANLQSIFRKKLLVRITV